MNTQEAIKRLKNLNYTIHPTDGGYRVLRYGQKDYCLPPEYQHRQEQDIFSPRQLIHLAKNAGPNKFHGSAKKNIKNVSKGVTRTNDRNVINSGNSEKIEELPLKRVSVEEDVWNWT